MSRRLLALAAAVVLAPVAAAKAGTIFLVSPVAVVQGPPPLSASPTAIRSEIETRFRGHPVSSEVIRVGIGPDGVPVSVVAMQRLLLTGTGDYFFVVPAPATAVAPGPGTESQPGLRDIGIVWQGFSDRHRTLAATVTLRTRAAARGLPLRVRIDRRGSSTVVRLENATARVVSVAGGRTSRQALVEVLGRLQAAFRQPTAAAAANLWEVEGDPAGNRSIRVFAPLRVRGTISDGGRVVQVDRLLGAGRPVSAAFVLPGVAAPRVRLTVDLLPPLELLPTAASLAASPAPLPELQRALGTLATSWAYRHYLGSPDPVGASTASYLYRTTALLPATVAPSSHGGSDTLAIVLGATLGAAALAGLAVLWARS